MLPLSTPTYKKSCQSPKKEKSVAHFKERKKSVVLGQHPPPHLIRPDSHHYSTLPLVLKKTAIQSSWSLCLFVLAVYIVCALYFTTIYKFVRARVLVLIEALVTETPNECGLSCYLSVVVIWYSYSLCACASLPNVVLFPVYTIVLPYLMSGSWRYVLMFALVCCLAGSVHTGLVHLTLLVGKLNYITR